LIAIGFDEFHPSGDILPALFDAVGAGAIRIIDLQFVSKDANGQITSMEMSGLSPDEQLEFGAVIGALIGEGVAGPAGAAAGAFEGALAAAEKSYGMSAADVRTATDNLVPGGAGALLMIEHHWAIGFRDAVIKAGGRMLAQGFLTPETLVMLGAELEAQAEAARAIELSNTVKLEAAREAARALALSQTIQEDAARQAVEALVAARLIKEDALAEAEEVVAAALTLEKAALRLASNPKN